MVDEHQHRREFVAREATDAEAKALASGLRLRMLRITLDEPLTNREIAKALGLNPATALHHVRTLVDTGYLEALEPRRGNRGAREIPYRATGKSWYTRTPFAEASMLEAFLAEFEAVSPDERDLVRLGLRLPADQMDEFRQRLRDLVQEFHDRPSDLSAEPWSVFIAVHPDHSRTGRPRPQPGAPRSSTLE
ncbi:helix-turn-helix domain-containing protein [Propionibacteriaceae bacterium G57]|uniref:helix-turn-helix domain-containing protein n=1 Tax=Aestuariimicrobium sp. G57 TaxID=3418485 RepID=UPI003DA74440